MYNEKELYKQLDENDIRYLAEQAGYHPDTIWEDYHYGCDGVLKAVNLMDSKHFKQDHCQYGFNTCPCFSQWLKNEHGYARQAIYVDKSVASKCPVAYALLKTREMRKKRERWIRKFNKKRA
jgi:hypothetical protein